MSGFKCFLSNKCGASWRMQCKLLSRGGWWQTWETEKKGTGSTYTSKESSNLSLPNPSRAPGLVRLWSLRWLLLLSSCPVLNISARLTQIGLSSLSILFPKFSVAPSLTWILRCCPEMFTCPWSASFPFQGSALCPCSPHLTLLFSPLPVQWTTQRPWRRNSLKRLLWAVCSPHCCVPASSPPTSVKSGFPPFQLHPCTSG